MAKQAMLFETDSYHFNLKCFKSFTIYQNKRYKYNMSNQCDIFLYALIYVLVGKKENLHNISNAKLIFEVININFWQI